MATELELIHILKGIVKLLFEEKEALLNSDGHVVAEIVEKKNEYIEKLSAFKGIDIEKNEKVMSLIKEIDDLQETNLLLTKQALGYQEMLLESLSQSLKNTNNTYSPKGNYSNTNVVNFVDKSL